MRGSIQKKGKIYYAVISLNGKRKWIRGGPRKKDAERELNGHLGEVQSGTYRELPKMTFREFTEKWLHDYADVFIKPSTKSTWTDIINRLLLPVFSENQIRDITTGQLQAFVSSRAKKVMPNTVRNDVTVIKLIFKYAKKWGYIRHNPAIELEKPKIEKSEIEILSPEEFELFLSKSDKSYHTAFLTAFLTGMRAGELWGLKWGDIDWNSKQIHVKRSLWRQQFQKPKSKYSLRKIDMTERLIRELKLWKLASPINDHDLVFPSPEGKPSQHDNVIKRHFNPALRGAGLHHVSFHSLRHSNASLRIKAGQNIKYIQGQLGHASIKMTMDINGHLLEDADFSREQVALLESVRNSVRNPLEETPNLNYAAV
jgi:integrase